MDFLWITLTVKNLDKTIKFYEDIIGLQLKNRMRPTENVEVAFLEDGKSSTYVELYYNKEISSVSVGSDYSIGFETESVDDMLELAKKKNIKVVSDVIQPTPKLKFFYILDPDGRKVQFVQHL